MPTCRWSFVILNEDGTLEARGSSAQARWPEWSTRFSVVALSRQITRGGYLYTFVSPGIWLRLGDVDFEFNSAIREWKWITGSV